MKGIETGLYCLSFTGLAWGLWLVVKSGSQISNELSVAAAASVGVAPPEFAPADFQMNPEMWGPAAATHLADAAQAAQLSQTKGAWIAFLAGLVGLTATLLTIWA